MAEEPSVFASSQFMNFDTFSNLHRSGQKQHFKPVKTPSSLLFFTYEHTPLSPLLAL